MSDPIDYATLQHLLATGTVPVTHACQECGGSGEQDEIVSCRECNCIVPSGFDWNSGRFPCGHDTLNWRSNTTCFYCDGRGTIVTDIPLTVLLHPQTLEAVS